MSEKIKEYAIYPGQIKINNEIFFGLDYKLTDFYNELAEENKQLKSQLQQKENIRKEVREYIENNSLYEQDYDYDYEENLVEYPPSDEQARKDILSILNKENK